MGLGRYLIISFFLISFVSIASATSDIEIIDNAIVFALHFEGKEPWTDERGNGYDDPLIYYGYDENGDLMTYCARFVRHLSINITLI